MDSNLVKRIGFAVVAIPLVVWFVWAGGAVLVSLLSITAILGTREVYELASRRGIVALQTGLIAAGLAPYVMYATLTTGGMHQILDGWSQFLLPGLTVVLLAQALVRRPITHGHQPLAAVSVTLFGVLYAAVLPSFLLQIRMVKWPAESWAGAALVIFPLVVTWVCDTAAMFGGRAFGITKLAPDISPGKTRAGAIAGVIGGTLVGPLFALVVFPKAGIALDLLPATVLASVLSMIGQIGDLAESLLKREAGVKDSSHLIPGHGGVLDRLDSLYFVIPAAAAAYHLLGLA